VGGGDQIVGLALVAEQERDPLVPFTTRHDP
jgi:hypothetical protein